MFKKLLGKILDREEPKPEPQKQHPRATRVPVQPIHHITFEMLGKTLPLINISLSGIGLFSSAMEHWPSPGTEVDGHLSVKAERFPVRVRLVYTSPRGTGCAYIQPDRAMVLAIHRHLTAELIALEMSYMGPESLKEEKDGRPHWYQGANNCELFLVENGGQVIRFHLVYFGNYVEGGEGRPVRFGIVEEDPQRGKASYKGSSLVRWENALDSETLTIILRFIRAIPGLPQVYRESLLRLMG